MHPDYFFSILHFQFYSETVKQMALHQLVVGSPLRTLCLLIAGQPAEVFSNSISQTPQNGVNVSHSRAVCWLSSAIAIKYTFQGL